jgi:peptidyl-prolyl cis-trans isomerase A (cyclophilin A)/peptidyl-prolyl cis-trans isomerase B (cyclophilin B)
MQGILALLLATAVQAPAAPAAPAKPVPAGPVYAIETSLGTITVALNKEKAPLTVANFQKYVRLGHYTNTIFHRVIPGFMIQGGGLAADMAEKPTSAPVKNEASNGLRNSRGTLAMARTDAPDSATAQFFVNLKDNHALDYGIRGAGYAVFGEVVEGMDVVDKIAAVQTTMKGPHENVPVTPVVIKSIKEVPAAAAK